MVASAGRGPLGLRWNFPLIDSGTLVRIKSPQPDPVGLIPPAARGLDLPDGIVPEPDSDSNKAFVPLLFGSLFKGLYLAPLKNQNGITVNAGSEITGEQWLKMLKSSQKLPEFLQNHVFWSNHILTMEKFKVPENTIPRGWLPDFLSAFKQGDWEISTFHLDVNAKGWIIRTEDH